MMKIPITLQQSIQQLSRYTAKILSAGDVFAGRVLSVADSFLLIQLADGTEISAHVKSDRHYAVGDVLKLEVIEENRGQLFVRELEHAPANNHTVNNEKMLNATNFRTDKNWTEVLKAITNMGAEHSSGLLEKAVSLLDQSRLTDPKHAAFLALNGMENLEQYYPLVKQLDDRTFHFCEKWQSLLKMLQQTDDSTIVNIAEKFAVYDTVQKQNHPPPLNVREARNIVMEAGTKLLPELSVGTSEARVPKINEWIKDIEIKLAVISEAVINGKGAGNEGILRAVEQLRTAIQFFNDILSYEAFVQLPLVLQNETVHGDLYIMKRKGSRSKVTPEDFSVFLSLSVRNLGVIETFIHVRNRNVMIKVTVQQEEFFSLLINEYKPLFQALKEKGYYLYELKYDCTEGVNLFNAIKKADEITENIRRIDIKL
jgi:hypothetical protein